MRLFICGSALQGQPGHRNLGGARFIGPVKTASRYRMHNVRDEHPGVYEVEIGGVQIVGELYEMTDEQHRQLVRVEPPDLYEAPIVLEDGSTVNGMLYPRELIERQSYADISEFGGWVAYRASKKRSI